MAALALVKEIFSPKLCIKLDMPKVTKVVFFPAFRGESSSRIIEDAIAHIEAVFPRKLLKFSLQCPFVAIRK